MKLSSEHYEQVISYIKSHSGEEIQHVNGMLLPHLQGTFELLQKWGNPAHLCLAGLCHNLYGTHNFTHSLVDVSLRSELRALIGPEAEEIVYFFASCDRGDLYPQIGYSHPVKFRDRFTGEVFVPDSSLFGSFLELTFANELQIGLTSAEFVEATRSLYEPLFRRCQGLVSDAAFAEFVHVYRVPDVRDPEGDTPRSATANPGDNQHGPR